MEAVTRGGGSLARPAGARDPCRGRRRPGCLGRARRGGARRRAGRGGRRPDAARVPRPTATSATAVATRANTGPRTRWSDGGSAIRSTSRRRRLATSTGSTRTELDRGRAGRRGERIEAATEEALAAPYPEPDPPRNGVRRWLMALDFRPAIREALDEELERDEAVIFFGEDVAAAGGVFQATAGLQERHGADRVFDTPISELALSGAAFGSAATGLRPVIEIMFADFIALAMDSSSTRRRSTGTSPTSRARCRWSYARRSARAAASGRSTRRSHGTWFQGSRVEGRRPLLARRCEVAAEGVDPRRQPGGLLRTQAPLPDQGARPAEEVLPLGRAAVARRARI